MNENVKTLHTWIEDCKPGRMVFFGGAGVSTESGIPDFRSPDGLYAQKYGDVPPEEMISRTYFDRHPEQFYEFYFDRMIARDALPNKAHRKLAQLEQAGTLSAVVTQNIDGLHQAAGSKVVWELHGSVLRNYCMSCGAFYDLDAITELHEASADGVPRCPSCGGIVKPDVVQARRPARDCGHIARGLSCSRSHRLLLRQSSGHHQFGAHAARPLCRPMHPGKGGRGVQLLAMSSGLAVAFRSSL